MYYYQLFLYDADEKRHLKAGYVETKAEALAWIRMGENRSFKEREFPSVIPKIYHSLEEIIKSKGI